MPDRRRRHGDRRAETNLGDLCADAYRDQSGAQIGLVGGVVGEEYEDPYGQGRITIVEETP